MADDILQEIKRVQQRAERVHSSVAVQQALDRMAGEISRILSDRHPLVLCVMTGGIVPTGWLLPRLTFPLELDYVHATRYRGRTSGGELEWRVKPARSIAGRAVLLVDDIFDEGVTLARLVEACRHLGADPVFTAVLVQKHHDRNHTGIVPDFIGLTVPDRYVFGCGMDYKEHLRNLPAIYAVADEEGKHP